MRLSPRQIAVRARESANLLVSTLERGEEIPNFLRGYAKDYGRPGVLLEPLLSRDLVETLRREALLTVIARLNILAARFLVERRGEPTKTRLRFARGRGRKAKKVVRKRSTVPEKPQKLKPTEITALNLFRDSFLDSVEQIMNWEEAEKAAFLRDCELYRKVSELRRAAPANKSLKKDSAASLPFVDRCALVLDASMFEQARKALLDLQKQLDQITSQTLRKVFAAKREN
jgi:hypothetical protein